MHKLIYRGVAVCGPPSLSGTAREASASLLSVVSEQSAGSSELSAAVSRRLVCQSPD